MSSALLLAVAFVSSPTPQEPVARGQVFDGHSLTGWRGDGVHWSVRDGCIVGAHDGSLAANTFLVLDGEFTDFEFTCEVRLEGDNNSGVQYRSRVLPGEGFRVAGPQCDVHPRPDFFAMLYDEQGAGIVAERGQGVVWREDGRRVLGGVAAPWRGDAKEWHRLSIVAAGEFVWHEVDGRVVTCVKDERGNAPRSGAIALQLHVGPAMSVFFRDLAVVERPAAPVPASMVALLRRDEQRRARGGAPPPSWIWDERAEDGEEVFFRRTFAVGRAPTAARLAVTCDDHCRVFVNGDRVAASDEWEAPIVVDVTPALAAGENVLAVHGSNDRGPAALAARLTWREGDTDRELVSDAAWLCNDDDPDGWNTVGFDAAKWKTATVHAAIDGPPWAGGLRGGAFAAGRDDEPQVAVPDTVVTAADGSLVEALHLCDVPRSSGSWVSLCADPKGRLYASAEGGGLFRVTPARALGETTTIERVPVDLGGCHGLLWFRDSLYAVQNGGASGLWRLTDTDGDGVLDRKELLRALDGEGEHGPHSVVTAPDGENLLVLCGNHTKLPELAASRVPTDWREDRLLPRLEDPNDYWEGISPPGGWVCLVDPDGKRWELLCCGFRNPYDLAVLPNGLVVVFDADMEWDMGLPWYCPTRLLAVESGVDYGWRIGSAKWCVDWPDAPPPLLDVGPGSPTGMAVVPGLPGGGLVALDWTFGTVHLGGQPWLVGAPLPLTDVASVPGSAGRSTVYLLTGGRGLPSSLIAVEAAAKDEDWLTRSLLAIPQWGECGSWPERETRASTAILDEAQRHQRRSPTSLSPWWRPDWQRARAALERLPVAEWRGVALAADAADPQRFVCGLLALARQGGRADLQPVLDALGRAKFASLPHADRLAWLRVHALALLRLGPATAEQNAAVADRLLPLFPTGDEREDGDLAELLAFVEAKGFLDKAVPLLSPMRPSPPAAWAETASRNPTYGGVIAAMIASPPPTGQIAIANALRTVKTGWTIEQRRTFFAFVAAARTRKGGSSYDGYLKSIANAAWATCAPDERTTLAAAHSASIAERPKFASRPPKGPGRGWTLTDADALLRQPLDGEDVAAGRDLFHAASCASCHFFAGEGGNHGPDLTSLAAKFSARDVFESIVEPSRAVGDQYAGSVLTKRDGSALFGFVAKAFRGDAEVFEVVSADANAAVVRVPGADVAKVERSPLSPMPAGLVNGMSAGELRQLLAFLLSGGRGLGPPPTER
ncbi:MAG: DUF1080 domain-containing protein [Planctomycetes bacterium]|nr:DUF1080 domain-containing protein [Planctomycetota bacterium]